MIHRIAILAACASCFVMAHADVARAQSAISTSRSNIKHPSISDQASAGSLASYKNKQKTATGSGGKAGAAINTSRSNIRHPNPPPK
jgi:hypothetical protein